MIWSIDKKYKVPKCIYIDLNSDVTKDWACKVLEEIEVEGWKVHRNENWTRKGYAGQEDSNIDIIIYKDMDPSCIQISTWEFNL